MSGDEIEDLRREIDRIDEELIELIRRRLEVAARIGEAKRRKGSPIRDLAREAEVEERWARLAREKGVFEDLALGIARMLIRHSLAVQSPIPAPKKRVALIGYGGMARTLGMLVKAAGHTLVIGGRNAEKAVKLAQALGCGYGDPRDIVRESDYILLALSRGAFIDGYVDTIAPYMKGKVVMDILSAKSGVYEKMVETAKSAGFSYISTHPLFGPSTTPYGETVVLIPGSCGGETLEEAVIFWSSLGLVPVIAGYDEHERAMAVVQVIPHLYMIALSKAIEDLSRRYGVEYKLFRTYNVKKIEEVIERVRGNIDVVREIQVHNKYASEARRVGAEALISIVKEFGGV